MQPLLPPSLASALIAAQNGQTQLAVSAEMRKMDAQDSRLALINAGQSNVDRAVRANLDTLALIDAGQSANLDTLALIDAGQSNVQRAALTSGLGATLDILV